MRYALVFVVLLSGCGSMLEDNRVACERLGFKEKDAAECAVRLYEAQMGGGTVRVTK
jgi:hypothetical protein